MQRLRFTGLALAWIIAGCATTPEPPAGPASSAQLNTIAQQVEIRRTEHGVPHILADNLRAAAFALAYVQLEDHGTRIIEGMNAARGRSALVEGPGRAAADADARRRHARARAAYDSLRQDTRDVYEGFAAGINHYIRTHRDEMASWVRPDFTAHDVLARDIVWPSAAVMNRFRRRLLEDGAETARGGPNSARVGAGKATTTARYVIRAPDGDAFDATHVGQHADNVGSNAWALAPSRTTSGHAILLRNPHLAWTAGYYEAHIRVPGKLDFYGDFRIGGPFTIIGGFNRDVGFATTNNASHSHEFYALQTDPTRPDHYVLDGVSTPLQHERVTVETLDSMQRTVSSVHDFWITDLGPVVHRDERHVYILKSAAAGEFRAGEQWLRMMQAGSLEEWKDAMRTGARTSSSFTYADRAGNILYVWMSGAPVLPHEAGGDTLAIRAASASDMWSHRVPFDSLPQLLNPPGGYLHNENDSPHYTNMNAILSHSFRFPVEEPRLRLRSQHAVELLHNERRFSLEDVVEAKHSMRMLLADRVKADLIAGVHAAAERSAAAVGSSIASTAPDSVTSAPSSTDIAGAAALLGRWDNTAAADARGAVLFGTWWDRYRQSMRGESAFEHEWSAADPMNTPRGIADIDRAVEAFEWAVSETARRFGAWDVAWGEVHRVRRGDVDAPVGGCAGDLGCFRVLNFSTAADGRRVVDGGDGWVIAVEFGDEPRAYSVLAYGQSPDPASPYHDSQAAMFADNRMKRVLWTEADIERGTVVRYRPGTELY